MIVILYLCYLLCEGAHIFLISVLSLKLVHGLLYHLYYYHTLIISHGSCL
jgi:hypothetical protein